LYNFTSSSQSNTLALYVDGRVQYVFTSSNGAVFEESVYVSAGSHQIVWNYHQEAGSYGTASISTIAVSGTSTGGAQQVSCPAGEYSPTSGSVSCSLCNAGTYSTVGSNSCTPCPLNSFSSAEASSSCTTCANGTYTSQSGAIYCQTNCTFGSYSLASLQGVHGPIYDYQSNSYYINLCDVQQVKNCSSTHACEVATSGYAYDDGNYLSYVVSTSPSSGQTLELWFNNGDSAGCSSGSTRSTVIYFICDSDVSEANPTYEDFDSDTCVTTFTWRNLAGCPVCTPNDYNTVTGACESGSRSVTKTRNAVCNGPSLINLPSTSCQDVEFPLGVVFFFLGLVIVLVGVSIFVWVRHRKLSANYSRLVENRDHPTHIELPPLPSSGIVSEPEDGKGGSSMCVG